MLLCFGKVIKMKVYSEATQRTYDDSDAVFYRNMIQSAFMMGKPDCTILDVFESNGKLVIAFPREFHKKYIKEWAERKHDDNGDCK